MDNSDISYDVPAFDRPAAGAPAGHRVLSIGGRVVGAGLLLGMAWIHWRLYNIGFSSIAMIGPAFYANAVLGVLAAAAVLVTPSRWLAVTAGAAALLDAGTLFALILSLSVGLFGYHETSDAPFVPVTIVVELLGAVELAWLALLHREPLLGRLRALAARRRS
ncbi:MAG: hypothetical protein QOF57_2120 [Frankiaceae bacterium]|jgi:hypothetical protein|nr:hypothetical protein [Frankiaceae bacterium]MDQ1726636.1 hypothetical protein [Frankiaceae bacterium]